MDEASSAFDGSPARDTDVFLAYNSRDPDAVRLVRTIESGLRKRDLRCWMDALDSVAGRTAVTNMVAAITKSKCLAFLLGSADLGRWQSGFELPVALQHVVENRGRIFTVLLPGAPDPGRIPDELRIYTSIDLRPHVSAEDIQDSGWDELEAAVRDKSVRELREWRESRKDPSGVGASPGPQQVVVGRCRALLVGVAGYGDPELPDLTGPVNDVRELCAVLQELEIGRDGWSITRLVDPTHSELSTELQRFFGDDQVAPEDTLLLYFSGHGVTTGGTSYLCASDTTVKNAPWHGVAAYQIVALLQGCPAKFKVVILDCCHGRPLSGDPYRDVGAGVAVFGASEGWEQDGTGTSPSPFTAELLDVVRRSDFGTGPLSVGTLLGELRDRGRSVWTNDQPARGILLASGGPSTAPDLRASGQSIFTTISADSVPMDRLPLLCQVDSLLDSLLAMAPQEGGIPGELVQSTIRLLSRELADIALTLEQQAALTANTGAQPSTVGVRFVGTDQAIRTLPWELLGWGLVGNREAGDAQPDISQLDAAPVARVVTVPRHKAAGALRPQRIALFNTFDPDARQGVGRSLLTAVQDQLTESGIGVVVEPVAGPQWRAFLAAPDTADVVVLQVPLRMAGDRPEVGFSAAPGAAAGPFRFVASENLRSALKGRARLTCLVIETVADNSDWRTATATRRLAEGLGRDLARPVIAVCHGSAYLEAVGENPLARTFVPQLVKELVRGMPAELAARAARREMLMGLAPRVGAVVGMPVVIRPEQRDERPAAVPTPARPAPPPGSPSMTPSPAGRPP